MARIWIELYKAQSGLPTHPGPAKMVSERSRQPGFLPGCLDRSETILAGPGWVGRPDCALYSSIQIRAMPLLCHALEGDCRVARTPTCSPAARAAKSSLPGAGGIW